MSGAAQLPQNFIPAGFSVPQLEHRIVMNLPRQDRDHHLKPSASVRNFMNGAAATHAPVN